MAERKRSADGTRETERLTGTPGEAPAQGGREGGTLGARVGTRDEAKAVEQGTPTTTRVRKSDEIATGTEKETDR
ncbi:hypothetical protein [Celeribacter indicus]|uniref:Uncharacterized protein n=1 Tax=Celeribacter indicus TaxID=1208324 RepID=A0A0B5E2H7_9RHOB|nr:hypothetical protein [Celeribacter indicus]AJE47226.1 hypothetical protein P73_2511 [Celeribacter indicus]SDW01050.1 hypothetical protein SAMN05443573_10162 [Celeribacter indicus]